MDLAGACWINDPESKGKVESSIGYVKQDFHYACSYTGLEDLNVQARQWCDEVANRKIHSTTGEVPVRAPGRGTALSATSSD